MWRDFEQFSFYHSTLGFVRWFRTLFVTLILQLFESFAKPQVVGIVGLGDIGLRSERSEKKDLCQWCPGVILVQFWRNSVERLENYIYNIYIIFRKKCVEKNNLTDAWYKGCRLHDIQWSFWFLPSDTANPNPSAARTAELFKAFGPSEILGWSWPRIRQWNFTTLKKTWKAAVFLSLAYGKLKVKWF